MRIIPLLLGLSAFACEVPEAPDAGRPVTDAGTRDAGLDAGNLCEAPTGSFIACTTECGLCTAEVSGYPLYVLQHPRCARDLFCSLPTRRAAEQLRGPHS